MKLTQLLNEIQAFYGLTSQSNRVWFNAQTGEAFSANDDGNHSKGVFGNLEHFGLTQDDLVRAGYQPGEDTYDYDGRILWAAIRKGWTRIFINPRDPDWNSNIEGISPYACRKALLWYISVVGEPKKIVIVVRTGPGDRDGFGHVLTGDQIEEFVRTGKLERELVGEAMETTLITMWHGGRGLEYSYNEMRGNNSNQMEYGPGLYLTSYYSTAYKYAKGGGKTYLVSFLPGANIDDVNLSFEGLFEFIARTRFKNKKPLIEFIKRKYPGTIPASNFLNLLVNYESMIPSVSALVRQYLVDNGADYLVSHGYGGTHQTIVVIFNPKVIKKVQIVPAKEMNMDQYELKVPL